MSGLEGLLAGRTLVKRYRIERVIGRGGFAAVYQADDERLGRPVAVKVITLAASDDETREELRERFQREARAAASLPQHPNIVTVHDYGTDPELDLDFLVMEYLVGEDLATYLARQRKLPLDSALRILQDAIQGIAVGHRAGLIHRDVKPGNIFLAEPHDSDPFRVCVLDFGIARATTADQTVTRITRGGVPLSPAYASPEQLRGETHLTPASDVFSLGVVAYQLFTGEKPLRADRTHEPIDWVPDRRIRELNRDVPPELEALVVKAMSFAPEDRYPSAELMLGDLESAVEQVRLRSATSPEYVPPPPAPAVAGVDDDRTLLQPSVPAAASHSSQATPRRSLSTWIVLLLVVAVGTVAGLWALTRAAAPDPADAPGTIDIEAPAPPDPGGFEGQAPRVTGEIVEPAPEPVPAPVPSPVELPAPALEPPAPIQPPVGQDVEVQDETPPAEAPPPPAEPENPATPDVPEPGTPEDEPELLGVPVERP